MSGLNQHPAKVSLGVIRAVGSNPTLTAKLRISGFESPVFRQIFKKVKHHDEANKHV